MNPLKRFGKYSSFVIVTFLFCVGLIAVYKSFDNINNIKNFLASLVKVLHPFIIGFIIAYVLNRPVNFIQGRLDKCNNEFIKNHKKNISIFSIYIISVIVIIAVLVAILPLLCRNIIELCYSMPTYINSLISYIESINFDGMPSVDLDKILSITKIDSFFDNLDLSVISKYTQGVFGITSNVINIFIGIIISIYMLLDKEKILRFVNQIVNTYVNKKVARKMRIIARGLNKNFSKFISSQLADAVVVSIFASIVLSIMRIRYGLFLGIMLGVFNLIPYFGSIFACVIAVVITIFTGGVPKAIWTAVALLIVQQIDGNIIGPKIMGKSLKVSPLLVIFAVTFGGGLFGIVGMLISVPIVAFISTEICDSIEVRERRKRRIESKAARIKAEKSNTENEV